MKIPTKSQTEIRVVTAFVLGVTAVILLGALTATFAVLYINTAGGFIAEHKTLLKTSAIVIIALVTGVSVIFELGDNKFIYRLTVSVLIFATIVLVVLYFLKISGFWDKIKSVEDLRKAIDKTGGFAVFATLIMQILQVVVLPIPGVIAIGASVALFGAFKGAVISFIGIVIGSLLAFIIGRKLGYKTTCWLVGKDSLDKARSAVKGKDRVVLTFMFLFPFFPDDILCFIAGLSSMSAKYFTIMIIVTRLISTFATAYSVSGSIIPYDTWWGIAIWAVLIIGTFFLSSYVYKHGEEFEKRFKKIFTKRKKGKK